jgi:hypothetical protein
MTGKLRGLAPQALEVLRATPALVRVTVFLEGDPEALPLPPALRAAWGSLPPAAHEAITAGLRARGAGLQRGDRALAAAGIPREALGAAADVGRAWHGLHFLLCGAAGATDAPLGRALLGGAELGEDLGSGRARALGAAEVAEVAAALEALDGAAVRGRYDGAAMDALGIYPGGWEEGAPQGREWLVQTLPVLQRVYLRARAHGHAMLLAVV